MRTNVRAACFRGGGALAATALILTGAPASATTLPAEVLYLDASRTTATTRTLTYQDQWYAVTVTGVTSYNGRLSQTDCGHIDPPDERGWRSTPYPLLDGAPAPCAAMPFHSSHTYCWLQPGTGDRLVFRNMGSSLAGDDIGALVIVVVRLPKGADPEAACALESSLP